MKLKNDAINSIFYDLIPGKQRVRLNFRIDPISLNENTRTGNFHLILDDPRWYEKKIDGEVYYIDSIDGNMFSVSLLVESFNRGKDLVYGGKGVPIYLDDFMSENKGSKTVAGLNKLIALQKIEEAFLSCNSIFLRRLRVLLFLSENHEITVDKWLKWNEKFRGVDLVVNKLAKLRLIEENFKDILLQYNRDRNRIDHEISEGSIESRDIIANLSKGISHLDKLEILYTRIVEKLEM